jgi:NADH:ubiquinone oxidoreductase subunit E
MNQLDIPKKVILFCDGSKCGRDNKHNRKMFKGLVKQTDMKSEVAMMKILCTDNCKCAPVIGFLPDNVWFGEVSEKKIPQLFEDYVAHKKLLG